MNIYTGKITQIKNDNKWLYLQTNKNLFHLPIKRGSVDIIIHDTNNKEVGIIYLDEGDIIKVIAEKNSSNFLIPLKIYVNVKYKFNDDSSDSEVLF
tara:strand:+ start:80 stop:367 length:288 start_codon:yes stop_codon:yes gene_type:complete